MQITGTLVVLIASAMVLCNFVVIAFWQNELAQSEIEHVRSIWGSELWMKGYTYDLHQSNYPQTLEALCRHTSKRCVGVVFSGGEHWLAIDRPDLQEEGLKLSQKAAVLQKEIVRRETTARAGAFLGERLILVAEPLAAADVKERNAAAIIIALDSVYQRIFKNYKAIFVYSLFNMIVLTVIGFFRLLTIAVKPIERMVLMSKSYQDPDVMFFGDDKKRNEFGQLSMALNGMLYRIESDRAKLRQTVASLETANVELLRTQKEMIHTEKMISVGRLSAGLAHEIGNPIGIVQGYVELLKQPELTQAEKDQFGQRALQELSRVNGLIRQLLDYAGSSAHARSIVNLADLLEGVCQIVSVKRYDPAISLSQNIPSDIFIECDAESLRQVFLNCLLNALDAIEAKAGDFERQITITAEKIVENDTRKASALIRIRDTGTGVEDKNIEVIFDPFFTTKDTGKGTGLGLFVSHSIIDAHGGKIWIESIFGEGSTVMIQLPLNTAADPGEFDESSDH